MRPHEALQRYERYRTNDKQFSLRTWAGEKSGLLNLVDYLGDRQLREVTPAHLEAWWATLDLAPSTMHTRLSQARSFFGWCATHKLVAADPTVTLGARRPMAEPRQRLTAAELLALIDLADYPQHRIVLALAANLAVRAGEIQRMRVSDVNLGTGYVRVIVDKTREIDSMPMSDELQAEVRRWLEHARLARTAPLVPSQWVSTVSTRIRYRPDLPIDAPHRVVQRYLAKLGWETTKQEGVHTVRRSVARLFYDAACAEDGENQALLATMRLLHHTRPETTLQYIGVDRQTEARDAVLHGRPFLTRLAGNVTSLRGFTRDEIQKGI